MLHRCYLLLILVACIGCGPKDFISVHGVVTLDVVAYGEEECPLCKQGIPIEKPGSRPAA